MVATILFLQQYEAVIYFVLGLGVIVYAWRFWSAWGEIRSAVFGLEQISAQRRLNRSTIALVLLLVMAVTIFFSVTFIWPLVSGPIAIYASAVPENSDSVESAEDDLGGTVLPTVDVSADGCISDVIEITEPIANETVRGQIPILGTVNIENFGFYKVEVAPANDSLWITLQAGREPVEGGGELIPSWDTSLWPPGSYVLQLVVYDNDGDSYSECRLPINIGADE